MAKFFDKLNAEGGASAPQFLSDHPNPANREKAIEQEAARLPERTYGYEWQVPADEEGSGNHPRAAT